MGLFGKKSSQPPQEDPIHTFSYGGFWIHFYPNRLEFKAGVGSQSVPITQIASVQVGMMGVMQITLETTGGQKYSIPTNKKKEVQRAIYEVQSLPQGASTGNSSASVADEIAKFSALKDKGIISAEDFEAKKKQLLGM